MSAMAARLSSPRFQRKLFWVGGSLLTAGLTAAVVTLVWTSPKARPIPPYHGKVQVPAANKTVPFERAAAKVGERFIETAVARKHLAESWTLIDATLKSNFTLKRWETGAIPVVPYPADTTHAAPVKVEYSYRDSVLLLILLQPKHGITAKPQLFHLGLHAFGNGKSRHWLVDYWAPFGAPKIPQN
jgi:hypothetical protein